jgi:hypothetical protein
MEFSPLKHNKSGMGRKFPGGFCQKIDQWQIFDVQKWDI